MPVSKKILDGPRIVLVVRMSMCAFEVTVVRFIASPCLQLSPGMYSGTLFRKWEA